MSSYLKIKIFIQTKIRQACFTVNIGMYIINKIKFFNEFFPLLSGPNISYSASIYVSKVRTETEIATAYVDPSVRSNKQVRKDMVKSITRFMLNPI